MKTSEVFNVFVFKQKIMLKSPPLTDTKRRNALRFMGIPWVSVEERKLPRRRPQTAGLRTPPQVSHAELPRLEESPTRSLFVNTETQFTDDECLQISVATDECGSAAWRPPSRLTELRQSCAQTPVVSMLEDAAVAEEEEEGAEEDATELPRCDSIVSISREDAFDSEEQMMSVRGLSARKNPLALSGPVTPAEIEAQVWNYCAETNPSEPRPMRIFDAKISGKVANVNPTGGRRRIMTAMKRCSLSSGDRDLIMNTFGRSKKARARAQERMRTLEKCYSAQRFKGFMEDKMVPTPGFMENVEAKMDVRKQKRFRPKSLPPGFVFGK